MQRLQRIPAASKHKLIYASGRVFDAFFCVLFDVFCQLVQQEAKLKPNLLYTHPAQRKDINQTFAYISQLHCEFMITKQSWQDSEQWMWSDNLKWDSLWKLTLLFPLDV